VKFEVKLLYYCDYSVFFVFDLRGVENPRTVGASRGGMGVGQVSLASSSTVWFMTQIMKYPTCVNQKYSIQIRRLITFYYLKVM